MNDFFSFLLSLLTFDWLRRRRESDEQNELVDEWMIMSMPQGECVDCNDTVYYDARDWNWKHLASHQAISKDPFPHQAVKWMGWNAIIAAEKKMGTYRRDQDPTIVPARVTTVGNGPKPRQS